MMAAQYADLPAPTPDPEAEAEGLLSFLYQLPVAVVRMAHDGTIELMNPAAAALLNRIPGFVTVTNLLAFLDAFDPDLRGLVEASSSRRGTIVEDRIVFTATSKADSSAERPALSITATWSDAVHVIVVLKDETEKVQAEVEVERGRRALRSMAAPLIESWDETLLLPVVGIVDTERAELMAASLLDAVVRARARFVIIDFTGVADVNDTLATHLHRMVKATTMMGCRCLLSGVSPALARLLAEATELDLGEVEHVLSVKDALSRVVLRGGPVQNRGGSGRERGAVFRRGHR